MLERARESDGESLLEVESFQKALLHYRGVPEQWFVVTLVRPVEVSFFSCQDGPVAALM